MAERNLDFDREIERRGTGCIKYDCAAERGKPEDVLPLWVADMDFATSSYVLDAMRERVDHGIFGYTEEVPGYFESLRDWMQRHHEFTVERSWLVKTPGVVFALAMAIQAYTEPGDAVLIQQPVYAALHRSGRTLLYRGGAGWPVLHGSVPSAAHRLIFQRTGGVRCVLCCLPLAGLLAVFPIPPFP